MKLTENLCIPRLIAIMVVDLFACPNPPPYIRYSTNAKSAKQQRQVANEIEQAIPTDQKIKPRTVSNGNKMN